MFISPCYAVIAWQIYVTLANAFAGIAAILLMLSYLATKPGGKRLVHTTLAPVHRRGEAFALYRPTPWEA
ncbi:MAG: hypothetical protein HY268_30565 [Deltaproteobacteria bacterium]|nr:hypothetical protein [Deltaproteobacteria bacterium]